MRHPAAARIPGFPRRSPVSADGTVTARGRGNSLPMVATASPATRRWQNIIVCFLNPGGIGEVILQTPFYEALKRLHPGSHLTVLTHRNTSDPVRNNPRIDELIQYTSPRELTSVFMSLRRRVFDQCFVFDKTWKSIYPIRLGIRAREYRGFNRRGWEALPLTRSVEYTGDRHETSYYFSLLDTTGDSFGGNPRMYPTHRDIDKVEQLFPGSAQGQWICLAAGGGANQSTGDVWFKRWPAQHYAALAEHLIERGYNILLVGGATDRYINNIILSRIGEHRDRVCDLTSRCTLVQSGLAMGKTRLVVTNDTGIMHLAACFNQNLLCLFGPTSPFTLLPRVPNAWYLWGDAEAYSPQVRVFGTRVIDDCLKSQFFRALTVDRVYESIESLLSGRSGGNALQIPATQPPGALPAYRPASRRRRTRRMRAKTSRAKFLLISPFTSVSGSAVRFWNIAQNLQNRGHEVVYVERRPKDAPAPPLENIKSLSSPKLKNLFLDIILSTVFNLTVFFRHANCAVYYALKPAPNNCIPALVAKLLGKEVILDVDDLDFGYIDEGFKREISKFFFNYFPRHFRLITCHTPALREYIVSHSRVPEHRIHFLTQGLSDVFLPYRIADRPASIPKSIVYLATLGITSDFGDLLPMFVNLCRAHPDVQIKIIGDGVRRSYFARQVEDLGLGTNVRFLGWIEHQSIPHVMADNWIGLAYMRPTFTNSCRAALKLREYLGVGLQVVCNDTGDAYLFREHVHIEPSIDMMERRVVSLLDQGLAVNEAGRRFLEEHFRWDHIIDDLLSRLEEPA
ncbi:MAG: glycosyltransferase [Chitinivibrionales bacterium]|nr:glycosyltransferase [Chitinivibrionales bacterium]MBD3395934.1 glycosyltransferase [Chitinivibrionales bacterium]